MEKTKDTKEFFLKGSLIYQRELYQNPIVGNEARHILIRNVTNFE